MYTLEYSILGEGGIHFLFMLDPVLVVSAIHSLCNIIMHDLNVCAYVDFVLNRVCLFTVQYPIQCAHMHVNCNPKFTYAYFIVCAELTIIMYYSCYGIAQHLIQRKLTKSVVTTSTLTGYIVTAAVLPMYIALLM